MVLWVLVVLVLRLLRSLVQEAPSALLRALWRPEPSELLPWVSRPVGLRRPRLRALLPQVLLRASGRRSSVPMLLVPLRFSADGWLPVAPGPRPSPPPCS